MQLCIYRKRKIVVLANYVVTTIAWLYISFLCQQECSTFCGSLVKFIQVSAPTAWILFQYYIAFIRFASHAIVATKYCAKTTTLFLQYIYPAFLPLQYIGESGTMSVFTSVLMLPLLEQIGLFYWARQMILSVNLCLTYALEGYTWLSWQPTPETMLALSFLIPHSWTFKHNRRYTWRSCIN